MKVKVSSSYGVYDCILADALTPRTSPYEYTGQLEDTTGLVEKTAAAFGKLAELLVEKNVISLEEALSLINCYDTVEIIK